MTSLKNFLNEEGQLKAFPAKRKMKVEALFYLAEKFEAGREYTEKEVNALLNQWHTFGDPATLRGSCTITGSWAGTRTGAAIGWKSHSRCTKKYKSKIPSENFRRAF